MQVRGDDVMDLENLFDSTPEDLNVEVDDPSFPLDSCLKGYSKCSPDSFTLSIGEIEQLLMKDDGDDGTNMADLEHCPYHDFSNDFLSDILLDSPVDYSGSGEVVDVLSSRNLKSPEEKNDALLDEGEDNNNDVGGGDDIEDPISKKRKRQLRNRDAAVRSRERKKTYVRDLELKSKYFEGECKRLGILLHCYLAENQALRNTILNINNSKKAFDDASSVTKQESAVLLLESLLLGSLLWFPGIIIPCLLLLLLLVPPLAQEAAPLEIVGNKKQGGLKAAVLSKGFLAVSAFPLFMMMMGKRCKASRSRMKPIYLSLNSQMFLCDLPLFRSFFSAFR